MGCGERGHGTRERVTEEIRGWKPTRETGVDQGTGRCKLGQGNGRTPPQPERKRDKWHENRGRVGAHGGSREQGLELGDRPGEERRDQEQEPVDVAAREHRELNGRSTTRMERRARRRLQHPQDVQVARQQR